MKMEKVNTSMRQAFIDMKVCASAFTDKGKKLAVHISGNIADGVGVVRRPEWNASLSLKTYKELKDKGIMLA